MNKITNISYVFCVVVVINIAFDNMTDHISWEFTKPTQRQTKLLGGFRTEFEVPLKWRGCLFVVGWSRFG